ncbi:uncharacterized protein APUU_21570S [Aspergillus puulaauensis]|uniref:Uncharacterized protein n=1 Tax=Aspergillus puulaauensis TaxID=1220207 RepID=A0A7R7XHN2_9EURO|nr:uncharacterized protein APUU_21570S [Aspergillus puulaauensis]BCS21138.1 hypothetical protein APUU_21570S [Aspergillus puulaauensis]
MRYLIATILSLFAAIAAAGRDPYTVACTLKGGARMKHVPDLKKAVTKGQSNSFLIPPKLEYGKCEFLKCIDDSALSWCNYHKGITSQIEPGDIADAVDIMVKYCKRGDRINGELYYSGKRKVALEYHHTDSKCDEHKFTEDKQNGIHGDWITIGPSG